ncbi:soluble guanylate cyclase 88E-like isoform X2 [Crassostrea angulata]|uniref:soluble guanylate cyclase 88E-like isoform X2 n=1 Tax=Magallana angulata TaxID=2784310 RepID=UPI0005C3BF32|nr:soluble guanylate cyclase 88E-like isoform X2 [Crassostrea angulata]|eukprot:XP_011434973.1 PREDICTED: soluble guanylate cyclase 88E isoform X2 [Crassostrea gigas]
MMYGLLLESIQHYIIEKYGRDHWNKILEHVQQKNIVFTTHQIYTDDLVKRIAKGCCHVFNEQKREDDYMLFFGQCFVKFFNHCGYDQIVRLQGRHFRDFLHGIDNLHEMMRYSYPRMVSPSFLVQSEDRYGCVLSYRSKRTGFKNYVAGQLAQCAKMFYDIDIELEILLEELLTTGCNVTFRINFDNSAYCTPLQASVLNNFFDDIEYISNELFFKVFPFSIVFNKDMVVTMTGDRMSKWLDTNDLIGSYIDVRFKLRRPILEFTWESIITHQTVVFELQCANLTPRRHSIASIMTSFKENFLTSKHKLIFRGQMRYIPCWDAIAFLCNPLVGSLDDMRRVGLYINDLNLFDCSRDIVLNGWQYASQLEFSLEQQQDKSKLIEETMEKQEEWRNKSEALLYSMIPRTIAERLKRGEDPVKTCEMFDQVTILFSYIVDFTDICAEASAMQIVKCINAVFTCFDAVVDKYDVFKVETLGDAVYMVAGGVPDRNENHAVNVAGLAIELVEKAASLTDPVSGDNLQLRAGMHTGSVVGGIVGKRMPQYCLFGDTVNTASRMQSYSEPGRIHLSEPCHECLRGKGFTTVFRGTLNVKGKGEMNTYWLAGRDGEKRTKVICELLKTEKAKKMKTQYRSFDNGFDLHGMHNITSSANFSLLQAAAEQDEADHKESKPKAKPKRALKKTNSSSLDAVAENSSDEQSNPRPVFV